MKRLKSKVVLLLSISCFIFNMTARAQERTVTKEMPELLKEKRAVAYKGQLEKYLQEWIVEGYEKRSAKAWNRDYSAIEAFKRSVEPNRERWRAVLNPPRLRKTGPLKRTPHPYLQGVNAEWVELPLGPISAQAILVFPEGASKDNPVPIVITQHGIGSYPETLFSVNSVSYKAYARELLKAGFAVLAPMNLPSIPFRNHIERYNRLIGTTLPGIELARLQHLLDVVLTDPRINADSVGMWGQSLGGMAAMLWMPLEPRIKVGVVSSWFNHRLTKMAVSAEDYVSFMDVDEEYVFLKGWLTEFSDKDIVALICPRPLMIHHGKKDRIAHWPSVVEEFNISKTHYEKLNISDKIEIELFDEGHAVWPESAIPFLTRWLKP